ncbi:MAG: helix-turn-helix domain-containing protein [Bacteroidales bacterium]|nr:helix-turn-helix domain-containing protein [Bacteroidales bacterium]
MNRIEKRLERIEALISLTAKEVLSVKEVAALINRSESRIRHLVSKREIPHYKNDMGQVSFLKSEVEAWRLGRKVQTATELDSLAATHIACLNVATK